MMTNTSKRFGYLRWASVAVIVVCCSALPAEEPNQTFATATVLSPGVLTVADDLFPAVFPDTLLGARNLFGNVFIYDDDTSPLGDGHASALFGISTNSGSISFSVTGFPDENFEGGHGEFGDYEVFVDVYDFFNDLVDSFSEIRTLQPGVVDEFDFSDSNWINGTYDAFIDNSLGGEPGDVDFFTFTGLTPGAAFTAETVDPNVFEIDTFLGWFDSSGNLLASDDDGAGGRLSLLQGIVPSEGMLTFAVTGFSDDDFVGNHSEGADYELKLTFGALGDFDQDGDVDGNDFLVWQRNPGVGNLADWQAQFGTPLTAAATPVPEPTTGMLLAVGCVLLLSRLSTPHFKS